MPQDVISCYYYTVHTLIQELSIMIFFVLLRESPRSILFPYTTLFRSGRTRPRQGRRGSSTTCTRSCRTWPRAGRPPRSLSADRKSTRLNSSHATISSAVFCLKTKKNSGIAMRDADSASTPTSLTQDQG